MLITFGEILDVGIKRLKQANIADAAIDAERLLMYLMNENRTFIYLHRNDGTDENHADAYFELIDRRAEGEPLQYIVGEQEFMGLSFNVNEAVLIPRQDTETLVETALSFAKNKKGSISILDMCCGSGAIAISMAYFLPKSKLTACDISEAALNVARSNAKKNGVEKKINFIESDLYMPVQKKKPMKDKFDMILCNPPYIPSDVIPTLQREIKDHEPVAALDGGEDGLDFYRKMVTDSAVHLKKGGYILFEIGHDQADEVTALLEEEGCYKDIFTHKDMARSDRVITARLQSE
ncbi:MAG: peptide chain release factor N(5)-glutamine methyltransferase [Anaerovoracaceae bacterium]